MNIARLNTRITIQKSVTRVDKAKNHTSSWKDYFTCWATASTGSQDKSEEAAHTVEEERLDFTVRYSSETAAVTPKGYRISFKNRIYDITGVDDMGFLHNSIKYHTTLKERT